MSIAFDALNYSQFQKLCELCMFLRLGLSTKHGFSSTTAKMLILEVEKIEDELS